MHAFVRGSTLVQPLRVAVPFVFSYLAMPVRQMLSGVVLDYSSPAETWLSAATRAVARESSAVGDEPGLLSWAALKENINETCLPCETYFGMLVMSVDERLVKLLQGAPAVGGINLTGTLQQQEPLAMD